MADTGFPCYLAFQKDPTLANISSDSQIQKFLDEQRELWSGPQRISKATWRQISDVELITMAEAAVADRHFIPYSPCAQSYIGQSSRSLSGQWRPSRTALLST